MQRTGVLHDLNFVPVSSSFSTDAVRTGRLCGEAGRQVGAITDCVPDGESLVLCFADPILEVRGHKSLLAVFQFYLW